MFHLSRILHIEATSKCTLKCPRCCRTEYFGQFTITDLAPDLIERRLKFENLKSVELATFGGANGDPIYHHDLPRLIRHFKTAGCRIGIETNGSHRPISWWKSILEVLGPKDQITFSIDGLADTNAIYRVGSDWDSIMAAVKTCAGHVEIDWKFIVFKHNQHQIEEARALAKLLNFNRFVQVKSTRFLPSDQEDPLRPDQEYIGKKANSSGESGISPRCKTEPMDYISATGYYFPCCWLIPSNELLHPHLPNHSKDLNLANFSLEEIQESVTLNSIRASWEKPPTSPSACRYSCKKSSEPLSSPKTNSEKTVVKFI